MYFLCLHLSQKSLIELSKKFFRRKDLEVCLYKISRPTSYTMTGQSYEVLEPVGLTFDIQPQPSLILSTVYTRKKYEILLFLYSILFTVLPFGMIYNNL